MERKKLLLTMKKRQMRRKEEGKKKAESSWKWRKRRRRGMSLMCECEGWRAAGRVEEGKGVQACAGKRCGIRRVPFGNAAQCKSSSAI